MIEVQITINAQTIPLKDIDAERFNRVRELCREFVQAAPGNSIRLTVDGAEKFFSLEREL